jgi:hypothetical protein
LYLEGPDVLGADPNPNQRRWLKKSVFVRISEGTSSNNQKNK